MFCYEETHRNSPNCCWTIDNDCISFKSRYTRPPIYFLPLNAVLGHRWAEDSHSWLEMRGTDQNGAGCQSITEHLKTKNHSSSHSHWWVISTSTEEKTLVARMCTLATIKISFDTETLSTYLRVIQVIQLAQRKPKCHSKVEPQKRNRHQFTKLGKYI